MRRLWICALLVLAASAAALAASPVPGGPVVAVPTSPTAGAACTYAVPVVSQATGHVWACVAGHWTDVSAANGAFSGTVSAPLLAGPVDLDGDGTPDVGAAGKSIYLHGAADHAGTAGVADNATMLGGVLPGGYVLSSTLGASGGVATLDATGKVPAAQLPAATSQRNVDLGSDGTAEISGNDAQVALSPNVSNMSTTRTGTHALVYQPRGTGYSMGFHHESLPSGSDFTGDVFRFGDVAKFENYPTTDLKLVGIGRFQIIDDVANLPLSLAILRHWGASPAPSVGGVLMDDVTLNHQYVGPGALANYRSLFRVGAYAYGGSGYKTFGEIEFRAGERFDSAWNDSVIRFNLTDLDHGTYGWTATSTYDFLRREIRSYAPDLKISGRESVTIQADNDSNNTSTTVALVVGGGQAYTFAKPAVACASGMELGVNASGAVVCRAHPAVEHALSLGGCNGGAYAYGELVAGGAGSFDCAAVSTYYRRPMAIAPDADASTFTRVLVPPEQWDGTYTITLRATYGATSGAVHWYEAHACVGDGDGYTAQPTIGTSSVTTVPTTQDRQQTVTLSVTGLSSCAGKTLVVQVGRDGAASDDTFTGTAYLAAAKVAFGVK